MADYYRQHFAEDGYEPKIIDMYSGDVLEGTELTKLSPYRAKMHEGGLGHLIAEQYRDEIAEKRLPRIYNEEAEKLVGEIRSNVEKRMKLFDYKTLKDLKFAALSDGRRRPQRLPDRLSRSKSDRRAGGRPTS